MPRYKSAPLSLLIQKFYKSQRPGQIMFCKRYKVEEIWDIGIGAVLDLQAKPHPRLVRICQGLFREDQSWFIGDIEGLLNYSPDE